MKRSQKRARRWVLRELGRTLARRSGRSEATLPATDVRPTDGEPAEMPERAPKLIFTGAAGGAFRPASFGVFMPVAARQLAAPVTPAASFR